MPHAVQDHVDTIDTSSHRMLSMSTNFLDAVRKSQHSSHSGTPHEGDSEGGDSEDRASDFNNAISNQFSRSSFFASSYSSPRNVLLWVFRVLTASDTIAVEKPRITAAVIVSNLLGPEASCEPLASVAQSSNEREVAGFKWGSIMECILDVVCLSLPYSKMKKIKLCIADFQPLQSTEVNSSTAHPGSERKCDDCCGSVTSVASTRQADNEIVYDQWAACPFSANPSQVCLEFELPGQAGTDGEENVDASKRAARRKRRLKQVVQTGDSGVFSYACACHRWWFDVINLFQALSNILSNAIKYTERGMGRSQYSSEILSFSLDRNHGFLCILWVYVYQDTDIPCFIYQLY
jgi:hypothetical protein